MEGHGGDIECSEEVQCVPYFPFKRRSRVREMLIKTKRWQKLKSESTGVGEDTG